MDKLNEKLSKLKMQGGDDDEEDEDEEGVFPLRDLNAFEMARVKALEKLQEDEFGALDKEYEKERVALEAKYISLRAPLFEQRAKIIAGTVAVPALEAEEGSEVPTPAPGEEDKGIQHFWSQTLQQSGISQYITVEDSKVLESLSDVKVSYSEDFSAFTVHFAFEENEFFKNKELFKTYKVDTHVFDAEPTLESSEFSPIEWNAGKNVTEKEVKKTQKAKSGKNKGQKRTIVTIEPQKSFFHWFDEATEEDEEDEDEEDEEKEIIKFDKEDDYEIAHYLRTEVIPKAISYFNGEIDDDEDYDNDGDDDDEDEDGDDEDDDEDEDEPQPRGKGGKSKGPKPPPTTGGFDFSQTKPPAPGEQPECKQN